MKTLEAAPAERDCPDCPELPADHQPQAAQQECYSGRNCTGKVLNHKDRHNCKLSGGKSWRDVNGTCYPI